MILIRNAIYPLVAGVLPSILVSHTLTQCTEVGGKGGCQSTLLVGSQKWCCSVQERPWNCYHFTIELWGPSRASWHWLRCSPFPCPKAPEAWGLATLVLIHTEGYYSSHHAVFSTLNNPPELLFSLLRKETSNLNDNILKVTSIDCLRSSRALQHFSLTVALVWTEGLHRSLWKTWDAEIPLGIFQHLKRFVPKSD